MNALKAEATQALGKLLILRLGSDFYAIPAAQVEEVLPALPVEAVPQSPPYVRGVVFVRGHLIPVLDAAERLGLKMHSRPSEPHIVCLRTGDRIMGVEFDEALGLAEVGEVESLDAETIGAGEGFFAGVIEYAGNVVRLLNPEKLVGEVVDTELRLGLL